MKKFVALLLLFPLLLGGCAGSTQGNDYELTHDSWQASPDGGGTLTLRFEGERAALTMENGGDAAVIEGRVLVDSQCFVIFDEDALCNYRFDYVTRGGLLDLTYEGNTVELHKIE